MKVLRLGISDDTFGTLPDEARSWYIAARRLEAETGDQWDTVLAQAWPHRTWPDTIDRLIAEEDPDLVLLSCAGFWVSYPSAPLRIHRSKLPMARTLARAGFWAGSKPAIAHRQIFHLTRRALSRETSVAFHFTPERAFDSVERAIRTVLRHEKIALAVRGPLAINLTGSAPLLALCESRRVTFNNLVEELCESLHLQYLAFEAQDRDAPDALEGDRLHVNAKGHAARAERESDLMVRAWRAHIGPSGDQ